MFLAAVALIASLALAACEPARTARSEAPAQPPAATDAAACGAAPAPGSTAAQDSCLGNPGAPADAGHRNVLGAPLQPCPSAHETGFYRDGYCNTGADDAGVHVVCARVTDDFLTYSRSRGNDLVTARGGFPGLRAGDGWCLCARRWREAFDAGVAPPVVLEASHEAALQVASVKQLSGAP
jgi:uncharacterized protein (DUF2237 family)